MRISDWSSDVCSSDLERILRTNWTRPRKRSRAMAHSLHRDAGTTRRGYLGWPCPRISCGRRYVDTGCLRPGAGYVLHRSEEHTSELQSLMRISYAVFCLKKKKHTHQSQNYDNTE